jgi:hypothetical protein
MLTVLLVCCTLRHVKATAGNDLFQLPNVFHWTFEQNTKNYLNLCRNFQQCRLYYLFNLFLLVWITSQTVMLLWLFKLPSVSLFCNMWRWFDFTTLPCNSPQWARASSFTRFLYHIQRRTTVGRTPLDEWLARRSYLYLTTHNIQQTNIHASGGIRTHDLSRRAAADLRLKLRGHWARRLHCTQLRSTSYETVRQWRCLRSCKFLWFQRK